jgi:long-chain acyl-CoA synthetase
MINANHLGEVLSAAADAFGERPALCFEDQWSSYRELERDSCRIALVLMDMGVDPQSRVVLHLPNSRDWIILYFAILKVGAVVVPVDFMTKAEELVYIIEDSQAMTVITGAEDVATVSAYTRISSVKLILQEGARTDLSGEISLEDLMKSDPVAVSLPRIDAEDLCTIAYTSGTTGRPKGAILSHRSIILSARWTAEVHARNSDDVFLLALPCTHVYGNIILHASLLVGGRLVLLRRFDAETTLASIAAHRVTLFEGVPTMYFQLMSHSRRDRHDLSSLTRCTVGGQSIPVEKLHQVETWLGVPIVELWGMTELAGPAVTHRFDRPGAKGTIGLPIGSMQARIDPDAGEARQQIGELMVRGPLTMKGYWRKSEATERTIDHDGWLRTGDLARIHEDGMIEIMGRAKEMIITAGYNIYPAELEAEIAKHPAVSMVAVGAQTDPIRGEIAVAYVVLKPEMTALAGEIEQTVRDVLAPYKAPRKVVFCADLPKTGSGKIMRHRLSEAPLKDFGSGHRSFVRAERKGALGVVTMHGPKGVNALNEMFITEIAEAMAAFDRDPLVRCMVLRSGTLQFFSVGADVEEMAQRTWASAIEDDFFTTGWARIGQCRKPLIAAVSGLALGGGCELALMADIIVASSTAEFGLPEIRLGIFPGAGGTQRLVRQIGKSKAMEMILTGDIRLSATEALALGLVSKLCDAERLHDEVIALAEKIAQNATLPVVLAKESINRAYESSLAEGLLFERRQFYSSLNGQAKSEGTRAFLEKRRPFFNE